MHKKKIMRKENMNYNRRQNDSHIHTLLDDMKKMNDVVTRLQQEITSLGTEVQELRQNVSRSSPGPEEKEISRHISNHTGPESGGLRETAKFEKQRELEGGMGEEPTSHKSNPWDDRCSTQRHHTVRHF